MPSAQHYFALTAEAAVDPELLGFDQVWARRGRYFATILRATQAEFLVSGQSKILNHCFRVPRLARQAAVRTQQAGPPPVSPASLPG